MKSQPYGGERVNILSSLHAMALVSMPKLLWGIHVLTSCDFLA